jgi:quinol monooxygenase YgiN
MSVVVIVTAFPVPGHRAEVIAAFEAAIKRVHEEPGVELYALHEGADRLVMIEKYTSAQARSEHRKGAALADLRSALEGKLSTDLDAQVLVPHPGRKPAEGRAVTVRQIETAPRGTVADPGKRYGHPVTSRGPMCHVHEPACRRLAAWLGNEGAGPSAS